MIRLLLQKFTGAWPLRLWLGAWLFFGSELILWQNLPARPPADLLLVLVGSVLIAALLLDLLVRFHGRDIFGLLLLAGIYSLCAALLLRPEVALADMPFTLVTRVMGAHTLVGFLVFLAVITVMSGRLRPIVYAVMVVVGLAWGIWVRWAPLIVSGQAEPVSLETLLTYGVGFTLLAIFVGLVAVRQSTGASQNDLLLNLRSAALIVIFTVAVIAARALQGLLDSLSITMIVSLIAFCLVMLWFQKREKIRTLLDTRLPPQPLPINIWLIIAVLFLGAGAAGWSLPAPGTQADQFTILTGIFTAFGVVWLPTVSLVLGARAYMRQIRRQA